MKETETDHNLLEEIATLSSRGSCGRLQIRAGATRGAFFFRQGKLVDARMGPFTGFSAINLAVSMGETRQSFDPAIQPPHSCFKDSNERTLIKERFGIDTFDSDVAAEQAGTTQEREHIFEAAVQRQGDEATFPKKQTSAAEKDEIKATSELTKPGRRVVSSSETNESQTHAGPVSSTIEPQQTRETLVTLYVKYLARVKRLLTHNTSDRFVLRAGFIILIVIPAAVVTASYWTEGKQTSSEFEASPPFKAEPLLVPTPSQVVPAISIIKTVQSEPQTPTRKAEVQVNEDVKTLPLAVSDRQTEAVKNAPSNEAAIEHGPFDKASSRTVVVIVQIAEGHVTEAYIQDPHVGLGAYESTALRIARERRYPKDKKGKEMVILQVTGRQKL